jgi:AraC-like DNA-binding protein
MRRPTRKGLPVNANYLSFRDKPFEIAQAAMKRADVHLNLHPRRSSDGVVAEGMVRMGPYMAVPALLQERGVDPAPLLAEFGLELAHFDDPEVMIPFGQMGRLFALCAQAARCPHFALLVGQRASSSALGAVGFLMESSPDVRTALGNLSRHYRVHNPNTAVTVVEEEPFVVLRYTILRSDIEGREHILDFAMAIGLNLMQAMCGPDWHPIEVRLARAQPHDVAPYQLFQSVLRFDEGETGLVFARRWMDQRPRGADPLLHMMMAHRVSDIEVHASEDLVGQVRRMLPALVVAHTTSLAVVAKHLGVGVRTLSRRLAAEGTSFMQLREEASQAMARQLLEGTRMPVTEIAGFLGYSNPSAFTRAFCRWKGVTPTQWRAAGRRRSASRSHSRK